MSRSYAPGTGGEVASATGTDGPVPKAGARIPVPSPVRSPTTPRGYVVRLKTLFGVTRWYGARTDAVSVLDEAHVFGNHVNALNACKVVNGVAVYSYGAALEWVGEREERE